MANADQPQRNGSYADAIAVKASGNVLIDGVLAGYRWVGPISYSDTDEASDYQSDYSTDGDGDGISAQNEGFSQFTAQQKVAFHAVLSDTVYTQLAGAVGFSIEGLTNLQITYAGPGDGSATIRGANSSDPGTAYAYYPSSSDVGGDTFFGNAYDAEEFSLKTPTAGGYAWFTMIHELGHSFGLKHGHETGGPANAALPADKNSMEFSVMTYTTYIGGTNDSTTFEQWGAPQSFMMADIAALQYMYGADFTTNSGSTTYSWNPANGTTYVDGKAAIAPGGNRIFATLWDGGGIDTYDLSNYTTNLVIDLTPGGYSVFSSTQLAYLGGGPNGGYARGNIFNALQYQGDARSLIENAIGGSGNDTITGNAAANTLNGGTGADTMSGGAGNDIFFVDNAGDRMIEASTGGSDTVKASVSYVLTAGSQVEMLRTTNDAGTDAIKLTGNAYANKIAGNAGANVLDGGSGGADIFAGYGGNDTYYVNSASDIVFESSGKGSDKVLSSADWTLGSGVSVEEIRTTNNSGTASIDLTGNDLANIIAGNAGTNILTGKGGADTLASYAGADRLIGGLGADTLYGGTGNDTFVFAAVTESGITSATRDKIMDFAKGDLIDLSAIDANGSASGDQAFVLDTNGSFSVREIRQTISNGNVLLEFNTDADSAAEMSIILSNRGLLVSADFIL